MVFWIVKSCLHFRVKNHFYSGDRDRRFLRFLQNLGSYLPDYTKSHPRHHTVKCWASSWNMCKSVYMGIFLINLTCFSPCRCPSQCCTLPARSMQQALLPVPSIRPIAVLLSSAAPCISVPDQHTENVASMFKKTYSDSLLNTHVDNARNTSQLEDNNSCCYMASSSKAC